MKTAISNLKAVRDDVPKMKHGLWGLVAVNVTCTSVLFFTMCVG
jgi:hypothetical protein